MMLTKIISGGQTGADQAGLFAAEKLQLKTGGTMPLGFRTDNGPNPKLASKYKLSESPEYSYPPRTEQNVLDSDGTLIFGNSTSPGCKLTLKLCKKWKKPVLYIAWYGYGSILEYNLVKEFITKYSIKILNVAGNRESSNPGICDACTNFLVSALGDNE